MTTANFKLLQRVCVVGVLCPVPMVGSPISRRVVRHRRMASYRALQAIRNISPVRPEERRAERNRIRRDRMGRADAALEHGLVDFDAPQLVPQPIALHQPVIGPYSEFVPLQYVQPQPMPNVDWAMVSYALFTIAEREHRLRANNPN